MNISNVETTKKIRVSSMNTVSPRKDTDLYKRALMEV